MSFCSHGGLTWEGGGLPWEERVCLGRRGSAWRETPLQKADLPEKAIHGRYASYLNAFLLMEMLGKIQFLLQVVTDLTVGLFQDDSWSSSCFSVVKFNDLNTEVELRFPECSSCPNNSTVTFTEDKQSITCAGHLSTFCNRVIFLWFLFVEFK